MKPVGYRVLAMPTKEEIEEKEKKQKQDDSERSKSIKSKKPENITEFQEGLMKVIRASFHELMGERKDMGGSRIGRHSITSKQAEPKRKQTLFDSGFEGEINRQQQILSMIGRSAARASNAVVKLLLVLRLCLYLLMYGIVSWTGYSESATPAAKAIYPAHATIGWNE